MLLFLEARKTDQTGYGTMMSRWRSGDALCPVSCLADYVDATEAPTKPDDALFPTTARALFTDFMRAELALQGIGGGGPRSPRRGGAAHLRVHLRDDSRRYLCAAGGWTERSGTAEHYAGVTIEATKTWSSLMVRPVTLI